MIHMHLALKRSTKLLQLAFPVMMNFFAFHLLGITDVIMVGQLGAPALAAVGLANTLLYFFLGPIEGFLGAALIFFPGLFAQNAQGEIKMAAKELTLVSIFLGIVMILFYPLMSWYLGLLSKDAIVLGYAREYLWIRLLGAIFLTTSILWSRIFLSMEKNSLMAIFSYIVVVINIIGNWLLIFGKAGFPQLGTAGAAWASTLAQFFNAVLFFIAAQRIMGKWEKSSPFSWKTLKHFTKIGLPMGMTYLIEIFAWTFFVSMVAQLGTNAIATHEIALKIKDLSLLLGIAIANVITQQVSFFVGKQNPQEAIAMLHAGLIINIIVMSIIGILYWFFAPELTSLVSKDRSLIQSSAQLLKFMALYQMADAIFISYRAGIEGLGKTGLIRNVSLIVDYLIWLPLAWVGAFLLKWNVIGAWLGLTLAVVALAIIFSRMFLKEVWTTEPPSLPVVSTLDEELK